MSKNAALLERAEKLMPGGVNSPVRAYRAVGGHPPFITKAKGAYLWDADESKFVDFVGSWGPAILGHAQPDVVQRVKAALDNGLSFGAPTELEVRFAEAVTEIYPSIEMLRCVSSGTEATMSALRVARGFTGRDLIVKFDGCYHGHSDGLLVAAGSGAATFGNPDSAGVPKSIVEKTINLGFNDADALSTLFAERGRDIAAVIVEPVVGNMGCVPPRDGYLEALRAITEKHGSVLIFDEVMTGCRLARGGAQERFSIRPDLTCLGKVVGGGMPLAVYGGRRDIMQKIAPLGPVYQGGTLSGNPAAVSAGLATLERLTPELYQKLEHLGARLQAGFEAAISANKLAACVQRAGSMITLFFHPGPVHCWADAAKVDRDRFAKFHSALLAQGVYWPASQFEAAFISAAHTDADIDQAIDAAKSALGN